MRPWGPDFLGLSHTRCHIGNVLPFPFGCLGMMMCRASTVGLGIAGRCGADKGEAVALCGEHGQLVQSCSGASSPGASGLC